MDEPALSRQLFKYIVADLETVITSDNYSYWLFGHLNSCLLIAIRYLNTILTRSNNNLNQLNYSS